MRKSAVAVAIWTYFSLQTSSLPIDVTDELPTATLNFPADLFGGPAGGPAIRVVAQVWMALLRTRIAKFGPDGMLYVLDQAGELWKVNADGTDDKTLFTTLQPGLDNMTFDEDGSLYMTNNDHGWVAEILPSGQARDLSPGGVHSDSTYGSRGYVRT